MGAKPLLATAARLRQREMTEGRLPAGQAGLISLRLNEPNANIASAEDAVEITMIVATANNSR